MRKHNEEYELDMHTLENEELFTFHGISEKHKNKKIEKNDQHVHSYKDMIEVDYDKNNMGYHEDYNPLDRRFIR